MIVGKTLPFITAYVEQLSRGMESRRSGAGLTAGRQTWLGFCLMCLIVTEALCWRKFVRASLGRYGEALLSWYFCGPMNWDLLLAVSTDVVLKRFGTYEGVLVIDDSDKKRAKVTHRIPYVHYYKNKEGTGTVRGQEVIFLSLVTPLVTFLVGFAYYQPDPTYTQWAKEHKRLKNLGVPPCQRPRKPRANPAYPTKQQLALGLLERFRRDYPYVQVKAVLADALYGSASFLQKAALRFGQTQVISQLRHNQKVFYRGRSWRLDEYFRAYPGVAQTLRVRGGDPIQIIASGARLYVEAQRSKCFVIALRYPEESNYRYLVATDLSWRMLDIVQAYTLRWWIETAIEDLKVHEGWGQATKQPGVEGSRRGLTLSLLCDHCLLLHPEQQARVACQEPLFTIGSLQRRLKIEAFTVWLEQWLEGEGFTDKIAQLTEAILPLVPLQTSHKHMCGRDLGRLEPTPALKYRAQEGQAQAG